MIRLRAFGTYAMRIADAKTFFETDRRHARAHDHRRHPRPAALDDPVEALGRDRRGEHPGARSRVEVRRPERDRGRERSDRSSRATASSSRASSSRTSRSPRKWKPRSISGRSSASSATASASTRRCRPPESIRSRPRIPAASPAPAPASAPASRSAARWDRHSAQSAAAASPASAASRRRVGRAAVVARDRRQDVRPVHRRRAARDGAVGPGRAVGAGMASRRRRLGARSRTSRSSASPPLPRRRHLRRHRSNQRYVSTSRPLRRSTASAARTPW